MINPMIQAKNVHLIGIGGIGTSAAAKWWKAQGATVTGSDVHTGSVVDDLEKEGIQVKIGHFADNLPRDCDLVIYSSAVPATNVEREAATEAGIPEWSYPEFLGELSKVHKTIAISGTNGKSTTTAMVASILIEAGLDPTVILGTKVPGWEHKNFRNGSGEYFVVEACEHMANMLNIHPNIAVITNIEEDHLDFYRDIEQIRGTFKKWIDDSQPMVTFGSAHDEQTQGIADHYFDVTDRVVTSGEQKFKMVCDGPLGGVELTLKLPGEFNAMNAAAAAHAATAAGAPIEKIISALAEFKGTWRRFEHVGAFNGADVYSDYAHHPTAIAGTIDAFKEFFPGRRLVLLFEPHQYSRTAELFDDFVTSFDRADVLILSEVYEVAGRNEFAGKTSKDLVEEIKKRGTHADVEYAENLDAAEALIKSIAQPEDVIVCMGAGAVDRVARELAE